MTSHFIIYKVSTEDPRQEDEDEVQEEEQEEGEEEGEVEEEKRRKEVFTQRMGDDF